jgi:hypothetical protein
LRKRNNFLSLWVILKNLKKYRLFALIIAMKRHKKNSVVFKAKLSVTAKRYGMSIKTFKKYLVIAKEQGLIIEKEDRYEVVKFSLVVRKLAKSLGIFFGHYQIIKNLDESASLDVHKIVEELLVCGIKDNIINQQLYAIERNTKDIELIKSALPKTEKRDTGRKVQFDPANYRRLKKLSRSGKICAQELNRLLRSTKKDVITSKRHAAKVLGISPSRATKTFRIKGKGFDVVSVSKWINGCTLFNYEKARIDYPDALVIPLPHHNKIKICFGSIIRPAA